MAFPFFADLLSSEDLYSGGYPVASQPPVILLQAPRDADASTKSPEPPSATPLMIELQNGRYVRVRDAAMDGEASPLAFGTGNSESEESSLSQSSAGRKIHPRSAKREIAQEPSLATAGPLDLPAAILVFRDGHSEEVHDYAIADGALYARSDYYKVGYWNKKIELSSLDLPQTVQANSSRGVKFVLPSSPNEVITRP